MLWTSRYNMAVFMLLYVWSLLAVGTVAFKPTIGQGDDPNMYTHGSITMEGVDRAAARFLTSTGLLNTSKTDHNEIVKEFFGPDTKGYSDYNQRRREFAVAVMEVYKTKHTDPDYTVNSERILAATSIITATRLEISSILASGTLNDAQRKLLVHKVGTCLMIIQSFYSNTNWIEMMMNGGETFLTFGTLASFNMKIAASGDVTCRNCDDSIANACNNNLLVHDRLTSGYLYGQQHYPKPAAHPSATEGKCSHGGVNDHGKNTAATGGINKETSDLTWSPHAHLHNISGLTAVRATEAFFMDATSGLLRGIGQKTVKDIFQLKTIIKQNISMGFVIDVTGSMADDIRSVKDSCIRTLSSVIGTVNEPSKYVLSTFNDPASLTTVESTNDGNEMIRWIEALTVGGGDDCPEFAVSGVRAAIAACDPYSKIYVATDADAKDENIISYAIKEANDKNITLQFILTANCTTLGRRRRDIQTRQKRGLSAFQSLVESTGGSIYQINHSEVTSVLGHALEKDFPSSEAIIDYFVQSTSDSDTMDITIDSETAVLVITITGPYSLSQASLSDPNGTVQAFPTKQATQYYSSQTITMSIQKPLPGIWKLTRLANNVWKVNVTASTYFDIDSQLKETDEFGISYVVDRNPIRGKTYTLEVIAYNLNSSSTSFTLGLVDEQGAVLMSEPVTLTFGSSKITGYLPFVIPSKNFFVQLSGIDQNGFQFKRMARKLISPVGVDLFVQPLFGNLEVGTPQNIAYTLSNLGGATQTYTVAIVDDKGRVQSPTSHQHTLLARNSTSGYFQILSFFELEYVTYTVSVTLPGSTDALQSTTSTAMFAGAVCSSFVTKKCRPTHTGSNCSLYTWSATAVFSFDVSTYNNVANVSTTIDSLSMNIDSTDRKRLHVSGTCCQDNFIVYARPSTGSGCETQLHVFASDQENVDVVTDNASGETHNKENEPHRDPLPVVSSNTGMIVGIVLGSAVVAIVAVAGILKVNVWKNRQPKTADSEEEISHHKGHNIANKPQLNQR